ncbi:MAG: segregation/condensation protein A [Planctomycetota bacterium]
MSFLVDLQGYRGPLDLLLYLVRKHEVEISSLRLADITEQFLEHLQVLEQVDVNAVGDFLDVASMLIEIKARAIMPAVEEEEESWDDPREQLVERLLEYKKYKDVASMLEDRARVWQQSYPRVANDLPTRRTDPAEQPIREVELWDLVSALGRVLREEEPSDDSNITYDDIPLHVHMHTIHTKLCNDGQVSISDLLRLGMSKAAVIGVFLAVLELVRHHSVLAEQDDGLNEIVVRPGPQFDPAVEFTQEDPYNQPPETDAGA